MSRTCPHAAACGHFPTSHRTTANNDQDSTARGSLPTSQTIDLASRAGTQQPPDLTTLAASLQTFTPSLQAFAVSLQNALETLTPQRHPNANQKLSEFDNLQNARVASDTQDAHTSQNIQSVHASSNIQTAHTLDDLQNTLTAHTADDLQNTAHITPTPDTTHPKEVEQIRTYRISRAILDDEQELLRQFRSENSFDLMAMTLERLSVIVTLMEQIDTVQNLPESFMQLLGDHFRDSLDTLERIVSFFVEMELVSTQSMDVSTAHPTE